VAVVSPVFLDNQSVIAAQTLTLGSTARGALDLRSAFGAYAFVKLGRGGTTALTNSLTFRLSRVLNNDTAAAGSVHPVGAPALASQIAAAASTTCATSDSAAGQPALNVTSVTGFAAGDVVLVQDSGGGFTRLEWQRVSKTAAGVLTLDRNLAFTHTAAGADTVRNKADVFAPLWLAGGSLWEVIADYGAAGTGESAVVQVLAQTYSSDQIV